MSGLLEDNGSLQYSTQSYYTLIGLIKNNPSLYLDEYVSRYNYFRSFASLLEVDSGCDSEEFMKTIDFLTQACKYYPQYSKSIGDTLLDILHKRARLISGVLRHSIVQRLIIMKNKDQISSINSLYNIFIHLLSFHDKSMRKTIYTFVINDIKRENTPTKNVEFNSYLQTYLANILLSGLPSSPAIDSGDVLEKVSIKLMVDLYHKNIWNDPQNVNNIKRACLSAKQKIVLRAVVFFIKKRKNIGVITEDDLDDGREEDLLAEEGPSDEKILKAYEMLENPERFAKKIMVELKKTKNPFRIKLLYLNLLSKLMCYYKLVIKEFYTFIVRYLRPNQNKCTHILLYLSHSIHEGTSKDIVESLVSVLMKHFVADYCSSESIIVGLNTIREIEGRSNSSLDRQTLSYIVSFKDVNDRGVRAAVKSIVNLYKEKDPSALPKKERGRLRSQNETEGDLEQETETDDEPENDTEEDFLDNTEKPFDAPEIMSRKIMTDEELKALARARGGEDESTDTDEEEESPTIKDIEAYMKKKRVVRPSGERKRAGKKFGFKPKKAVGSSTTNTRKQKRKNVMMVRQKITGRKRKTNASLRNKKKKH